MLPTDAANSTDISIVKDYGFIQVSNEEILNLHIDAISAIIQNNNNNKKNSGNIIAYHCVNNTTYTR